MADIELSSQLLQDIQAAVQRQQPDADHDMVMQYLAAVMGYLVGSNSQFSAAQRTEFLDDLCAFARHVASDVVAQHQAPAQTQQESAFGYWDPKEN